MGKRTRKTQKTRTRTPKRASVLNQELVVVATTDTMDEAKEYEISLKNNDIPAMVKRQQDEFADGSHYAVMVPEDMADEAHVVIESQDTYDDAYDFGLGDEDEEYLDDDVFEEGS
jgi:hypothetical protein